MDTLQEISDKLLKGQEEELIERTNLIERLPENEVNEWRPLSVLLMKQYLSKLEEKSQITSRDIQTIRLLHRQIQDQLFLNLIRDKGLQRFLNEVLKKLEEYLEGYYSKFRSLPEYNYWEKEYMRRRSEYGYPSSYYYYYEQRWPYESPIKWERTPGGLELSEESKEKIKDVISGYYRIARPGTEWDEIMEHTTYRLQQYLRELRSRREGEKQLSSEDTSKNKLLDIIIRSLKDSRIGGS